MLCEVILEKDSELLLDSYYDLNATRHRDAWGGGYCRNNKSTFLTWRVLHEKIDFSEIHSGSEALCGSITVPVSDRVIYNGVTAFEESDGSREDVIICVATIKGQFFRYKVSGAGPILANLHLPVSKYSFSIDESNPIISCSWLNHTNIALGLADGCIHVFRLQQGEALSNYKLHDVSTLKKLIYSPFNFLASGHQENQKCLCLAPVGYNHLVAVYADGKLRVWRLSIQSCIYVADLYQEAKDAGEGFVIISGDKPPSFEEKTQIKVSSNCKFFLISIISSNGVNKQFIYNMDIESSTPIKLRSVLKTPTHLPDSSWNAHVTNSYTPTPTIYDGTSPLDFIDGVFDMNVFSLFTLWRSETQGSIITCTSLIGNNNFSSANMICAASRQIFEIKNDKIQENCLATKESVTEFYLSRVFLPGRFATQTLLNALQITVNNYRIDYSCENILNSDDIKGVLPEILLSIVKQENISDYNEEDDYATELNSKWYSFLSLCIEMWKDCNESLAIVSIPSFVYGRIAVVRQDRLGILRPLDAVEAWPYKAGTNALSILGAGPSFSRDKLSIDQISVLEIAAILRNQVKSLLWSDPFFDIVAIDKAVTEAALGFHSTKIYDGSFEMDILFSISRINNLSLTLSKLVDELEPHACLLYHDLPPIAFSKTPLEHEKLEWIDAFIGNSNYSNAITINSIRQILTTRLKATVELTLLVTYLLKGLSGSGKGLDGETKFKLTSSIYPHLVSLGRRLSALVIVTSSLIETPAPFIPEAPLHKVPSTNVPLLDLYLEKNASNDIRRLTMAQNSMDFLIKNGFEEAGAAIHSSTLSHFLVSLVISRMVSDSSFVQSPIISFLREYGQFSLLKKVSDIMLEDPLCISGFLNFEKANAIDFRNQWLVCRSECYLSEGRTMYINGAFHDNEVVKKLDEENQMNKNRADECFELARSDLFTSTPLLDETFDEELFRNTCESIVNHNMFAASLFERNWKPRIAISFAYAAINALDLYEKDNKDKKAHLWNNVFSLAAESFSYQEAYTAMSMNPDPVRKIECLRRLVLKLCDENDLETLCRFPCVGIIKEVESILEWKARHAPVIQEGNSIVPFTYYHFLYSFYISRLNYTDAASIMSQLANRIICEAHVTHIEAQEAAADAYLLACNCLHLTPSDSWTYGGNNGENTVDNCASKTLDECEKELSLLLARIEMLKNNVHGIKNNMSEEDTIYLLLSHGMYERAISISLQFDLPLDSIFKSLSSLCIRLQLGYIDGRAGGLLLDDVLSGVNYTDAAWERLKEYLVLYDNSSTNYKYHALCANNIFNIDSRVKLPGWFIDSFIGRKSGLKVRCANNANPISLIRIYLEFELIEDACVLASECITFHRDDNLPLELEWIPVTLYDEIMKKCYLILKNNDVKNDDVYLRRLKESYQTLEQKLNDFYKRQESGILNFEAAQKRKKRFNYSTSN